ncbi:DNA repair protein RAD51 homolog 4 isoform X2 [Periplaneta americana]|uniref:DNA repair protein RAD51 homolog 4 isoform X2 n=1 Tax=Periplaneta americana TaxID=6978 RepID=UPI0037E95247
MITFCLYATEATSLAKEDIIQLRQSIVAYYAAFPRKGIDIYNEVMSYTALIPTGIESLDNIIEGGLMTGKVYEVCGPSGSGKTQLCLTISTHIANCYKQQVHYIDTKADFSGMRVEEMLTSCGYLDEVIGAVMERIRVTRIGNIYELFNLLHHFKSNVHSEQDELQSVRIIILDSLPILFFPFLGKNLNDGFGLMNQLANVIKHIVTECHVAFVIVNLAMQWIEEEHSTNEGHSGYLPQEEVVFTCDTVKPALGKYWLDVPCTRLYIHKIDSREKRQLFIMKSTILTTKKYCRVSVNSQGIMSA